MRRDANPRARRLAVPLRRIAAWLAVVAPGAGLPRAEARAPAGAVRDLVPLNLAYTQPAITGRAPDHSQTPSTVLGAEYVLTWAEV